MGEGLFREWRQTAFLFAFFVNGVFAMEGIFTFKACVIGCGKMGEAILKSLLHKGTFDSNDLIVVEANDKIGEKIKNTYKVEVCNDALRAALSSKLIVLAVKPHVVPIVAEMLAGKLSKEQLILSIAAGVTSDQLIDMFNHKRIVRAMPNLAAQISQAATVWTAPAELDEIGRHEAEQVLNAIGEAIYVANDHLIDVGTAISGSGPAYQYLFMEALTDAGVRLGLTRQQAAKLTLGMVRGAANLAAESQESFNELRYKVTTPGGTTAAAVSSLEKGAFRALIDEAAEACYKKSQQLAKM